MDGNNLGEGGLTADALQENARGYAAHLIEWLANGGETGIVEGSALDVVEAYDGNVGRNLQAMIHAGANSADGGDVVEADDGGEIEAALQQFVGRLIAEFGRRYHQPEFHSVVGRHGELKLASNSHEAVPAIIGIRATATPAHESDFAMPKLIEVPKREFGGAALIEDDIRYSFDLAMTGDGDDRNAETFLEDGVDENEAFDGAIHEEARILLD